MAYKNKNGMKYKKSGRYSNSMLKEDDSKPSSLPTEVIMKEYPPCDYLMGSYNDTEEGIRDSIDRSVRGLKKNYQKERMQ